MSGIMDVKNGRMAVYNAKAKYTQFIAGLITKFNGGGAITHADLVALVTGNYDPVTSAMNEEPRA